MERLLKSRYKIKERIGEGPFSITYRGAYLEKDDPLIIKIYKRSVLSSPLIKVVKRKVRELCQMTHLNLARVIDGDYGWQGFYFVREYVDGQNLAELLRQAHKVPVDRMLEIVYGICAGLAAAHSKGIVHGALNPNNVFIDKNGTVKLTDLIIVPEMRGSVKERAEMAYHNSSYLSPEEIGGGLGSARSDIYSVALLAHEMLSGKNPFSASTGLHSALMILNAQPEKLVDVPRYLEEVLSRALEKDPMFRFRTINGFEASLRSKTVIEEEAARDPFSDISLEGLIEDSPKALEPAQEAEQKKPVNRSAYWAAGVIFVAACLGIGYAVISAMAGK